MFPSVKNNHVDETAAARLFAEACASGSRTELAEWLREEVSFRDMRSGQDRELHGKADFLRFLTENIEEAKEKGYWHQISFGVGAVVWPTSAWSPFRWLASSWPS